MQAYRGLPILTAQPRSPTRLVGIWPLSHEGSVGEYGALAHTAIDELLAAGRTPVVAGGTGLYLRGALVDLQLPPAPSRELRGHWERLYDRIGAANAYALLAERDPEAASHVHRNDRRMIVRTRRYAAYQRKWMRRIPGLVTVNADRPPGEIADDILEMASARQSLPAGRAG